jgi:hypothetical protein
MREVSSLRRRQSRNYPEPIPVPRPHPNGDNHSSIDLFIERKKGAAMVRSLLHSPLDGFTRRFSGPSAPKRGTDGAFGVQVKAMFGEILFLGLATAWLFGLPVTIQVIRSTLRCVASK